VEVNQTFIEISVRNLSKSQSKNSVTMSYILVETERSDIVVEIMLSGS
jgi:hypothetical protein